MKKMFLVLAFCFLNFYGSDIFNKFIKPLFSSPCGNNSTQPIKEGDDLSLPAKLIIYKIGLSGITNNAKNDTGKELSRKQENFDIFERTNLYEGPFPAFVPISEK
jgi:hypothetical protein